MCDRIVACLSEVFLEVEELDGDIPLRNLIPGLLSDGANTELHEDTLKLICSAAPTGSAPERITLNQLYATTPIFSEVRYGGAFPVPDVVRGSPRAMAIFLAILSKGKRCFCGIRTDIRSWEILVPRKDVYVRSDLFLVVKESVLPQTANTISAAGFDVENPIISQDGTMVLRNLSPGRPPPPPPLAFRTAT
jgi:hypothetical protein